MGERLQQPRDAALDQVDAVALAEAARELRVQARVDLEGDAAARCRCTEASSAGGRSDAHALAGRPRVGAPPGSNWICRCASATTEAVATAQASALSLAIAQ
jgi:hypothetical protein